MYNNIANKFITSLFIASLGLAANSAMAGPDFFQQQINQRVFQAKQKLQQAEAAKGTERQKLMDQMMQEHQAIMASAPCEANKK